MSTSSNEKTVAQNFEIFVNNKVLIAVQNALQFLQFDELKQDSISKLNYLPTDALRLQDAYVQNQLGQLSRNLQDEDYANAILTRETEGYGVLTEAIKHFTQFYAFEGTTGEQIKGDLVQAMNLIAPDGFRADPFKSTIAPRFSQKSNTPDRALMDLVGWKWDGKDVADLIPKLQDAEYFMDGGIYDQVRKTVGACGLNKIVNRYESEKVSFQSYEPIAVDNSGNVLYSIAVGLDGEGVRNTGTGICSVKEFMELEKLNQTSYEYYVVIGNKIESGWDYRSDAADQINENLPGSFQSISKIRHKNYLSIFGIDPDDNRNWIKGSVKGDIPAHVLSDLKDGFELTEINESYKRFKVTNKTVFTFNFDTPSKAATATFDISNYDADTIEKLVKPVYGSSQEILKNHSMDDARKIVAELIFDEMLPRLTLEKSMTLSM